RSGRSSLVVVGGASTLAPATRPERRVTDAGDRLAPSAEGRRTRPEQRLVEAGGRGVTRRPSSVGLRRGRADRPCQPDLRRACGRAVSTGRSPGAGPPTGLPPPCCRP